jgi:hypothetical protein
MALWQKGQSGNPAGNVEHPLVRKVKARARGDAERAYEAILSMLEEAEKPEVRMAAAKQILAMAGANTPDKPTEAKDTTSTATPSLPSQSLANDLGPPPPTVN